MHQEPDLSMAGRENGRHMDSQPQGQRSTLARQQGPQTGQQGSWGRLAAQVALLVDKAVDSLWNVMCRTGPDGTSWADASGFVSRDDYRRYLAAGPDRLMTECRDLLWADHFLKPDEKELLSHVCAMAEALGQLHQAVGKGVALINATPQ